MNQTSKVPEWQDVWEKAVLDIGLPEHLRSKCDLCNERPWTHRHDTAGIETYVCDECASVTP